MGHGIRCTTGQNIIGLRQGLPVKNETCFFCQDACFTTRYNVTVQGITMAVVQGIGISDPSRKCGFCRIRKETIPLMIRDCKVNCKNRNVLFAKI